MPVPRLTDDGRTVTLDLHGVRLRDAESLIVRVVGAAAAYGRDRVRLIHGTSTSRRDYRNPTLRHLVLELLENGRLDTWVAQAVPGEGATVLGLSLGGDSNPARLRWSDVD